MKTAFTLFLLLFGTNLLAQNSFWSLDQKRESPLALSYLLSAKTPVSYIENEYIYKPQSNEIECIRDTAVNDKFMFHRLCARYSLPHLFFKISVLKSRINSYYTIGTGYYTNRPRSRIDASASINYFGNFSKPYSHFTSNGLLTEIGVQYHFTDFLSLNLTISNQYFFNYSLDNILKAGDVVLYEEWEETDNEGGTQTESNYDKDGGKQIASITQGSHFVFSVGITYRFVRRKKEQSEAPPQE